ncbi:MAG: succinylglutamate desuccinylase/aspartoacylase family protein [Planctomycetota bacterium]
MNGAAPEARWGAIRVADVTVAPGEVRDVWLPITRDPVPRPAPVALRVVHGAQPGPALFVIAGLHGDELNGVGIVQRLMAQPTHDMRGTLFLVPIANAYGFHERTRYLADGRDLNRCFPGDPHGSFASRLAATLFDQIVRRSSAGIDLHTAPRWRANVPHVRINLAMPGGSLLVRGFGESIVLDDGSREGTLRRAAQHAHVPVLLFEAGDPFRFQADVIDRGWRGVRSVMVALGMIGGRRRRVRYRVILKHTHWIRAEQSGILEMAVAPGDWLRAGTAVATTSDAFGRERSVQISPYTGLVLGVTTHPSVNPGDPLCHIGVVKRAVPLLEKHLGPAKHVSGS